MSITGKETGNPSKRKGDRGEERRRQVIEEKRVREEKGQRGKKRRKRKEETMSNERVRVIRVSTTWIYIVFFRY